MSENYKSSPLLVHVIELEKRSHNHSILLSEIIDIFGVDGHFVLILFLILPFLQPIPLVGLSTPFGLMIALVASLYYFNKPPFIPQRWKIKKVNKNILLKIIEASEYFFKKLSRLFKKRLEVLFSNPFRTLNFIFIVVSAILLALPLPIPFSNALPAWTIFFQTLGHLERDGLLIIISYIQGVVSYIFFALLAMSTVGGLEYLNKLLN